MFVRKKRNRTGSISVVVVDKSRGGFKEIKRFGVARSEEEADTLYAEACLWVDSIFCGSQYEGFTMILVVEDFVRRFSLEDFVVVTDSGLMSKKNLALLRSGGYKYILGARIRNEATDVREWILSQDKEEKKTRELLKATGTGLS